jgi:deferrochelatase/peroxidase EfeB
MNKSNPTEPSRRGFLAAATSLVAAAGVGVPAAMAAPQRKDRPATGEMHSDHAGQSRREPFWGHHQGGIITPAQQHTYFAAFDIISEKREDLVILLQRWTEAAARMSEGYPAMPLPADLDATDADTADSLELAPSRLTVTFGFGAGLFQKNGQDRFGLAAHRPEALVDMPTFPGDQLVDTLSDGDLSVQACAEDAQVAFHTVRQLARLAEGIARIRWVQIGFIGDFGANRTPRNLMGFKDGTGNPPVTDRKEMESFVWVGDEGPDWMRGGSYVVVRRSRMALEHWDRMKVSFQEQTFGRRKYSGAPLSGKKESDPLDLSASDEAGNPQIPENSHVRLATAASNGGIKILRRSYSYNDGINVVAERWPPWHQGLEYDAGLIFVCYQKDPRTGFIPLFENMSRFDMMNQFVTNLGSGLFACPGGAAKGEYIGQRLFEKA